jgi:hypothetical protein
MSSGTWKVRSKRSTRSSPSSIPTASSGGRSSSASTRIIGAACGPPWGMRSARWTSYGLSYEALRRSAARGKYDQFAYIYRACSTAHNRYLKRAMPKGYVSLDDAYEPASEDQVEVVLDVQEALDRLGPVNGKICRMHLLGGASFAEIGRELGGMDRSTVQRRFGQCLPRLRAALAAYDEGPRPAPEEWPLARAA